MAYQQQTKTAKFLSPKEERGEYKSKDILVVEEDGRKIKSKDGQWVGGVHGEGTALIGEDKEKLLVRRKI